MNKKTKTSHNSNKYNRIPLPNLKKNNKKHNQKYQKINIKNLPSPPNKTTIKKTTVHKDKIKNIHKMIKIRKSINKLIIYKIKQNNIKNNH
jgi:hypothetical protein